MIMFDQFYTHIGLFTQLSLFLMCIFINIATCDDPGVVVNGQRKGDTFIDGDSVEFICDVNYSLIGSSIIRCLGGKWSSALPQCKGKTRTNFISVATLHLPPPQKKGRKKRWLDEPNCC